MLHRELHLAAQALDAQRALHFVLVGGGLSDLMGRKAGFGKSFGVEPRFGHDLVVGLGGAGVHAGQFDVEAGFGLFGFGGVKVHLRGKLFKAPVHGHAHLLVAEGDAAFGRHDGGVRGGLGLQGERGDRQGQQMFQNGVHGVSWGLDVRPGSMRRSVSSW